MYSKTEKENYAGAKCEDKAVMLRISATLSLRHGETKAIKTDIEYIFM